MSRREKVLHILTQQERWGELADMVVDWNTMPEGEYREMLRDGAEELDAFLRERRNRIN